MNPQFTEYMNRDLRFLPPQSSNVSCCLVRAAVNHLCTVSPDIKLALVGLRVCVQSQSGVQPSSPGCEPCCPWCSPSSMVISPMANRATRCSQRLLEQRFKQCSPDYTFKISEELKQLGRFPSIQGVRHPVYTFLSTCCLFLCQMCFYACCSTNCPIRTSDTFTRHVIFRWTRSW